MSHVASQSVTCATVGLQRIMGEAVCTVAPVPATTAVLPVWACGLRPTLLVGAVHRHFVEIRIACWRQFRAMRAQAFNHVTVFPGDPTAKPLRIGTARSSQGAVCYSMGNGQAGRCWGCILHIFRRWGPSGSRSPRYRGGSNGWRRRRLWDLNENFLVDGL